MKKYAKGRILVLTLTLTVTAILAHTRTPAPRALPTCVCRYERQIRELKQELIMHDALSERVCSLQH